MGSCVATESKSIDTDPTQWDQNDVAEWLNSIGHGQLHSLITPFTRHKIVGSTLFKLTNKNLKNDLKIKQFGLRQQFTFQRDKLFQNHHSHTNKHQKQWFQFKYAIPSLQWMDLKSMHVLSPSISEEWQCKDVTKWLKSFSNHKLTPLIHTFKQHKIDGVSLLTLTNSDLKNELNIQSLDVRKQFIAERDKLRETHCQSRVDCLKIHKIDIPLFTEQSSDNSDSLTCSIFKTPHTIDTESDEMIEFGMNQKLVRRKNDTNSKSLSESSFTLSPQTAITQIAGVLFQNKLKNTLYKSISLSEDTHEMNMKISESKQFRIIHKAKEIKEQHRFNPKQWNFNIVPFTDVSNLEIIHDFHVLQQYGKYSYLYASKLVIDSECAQIPNVIKNICFKYYFEYEYHILQFGYDISRIVDHIDVYYGGPLTFTGHALMDILYNTHFRHKYRIPNMDTLIAYINESVQYGFIERVATKRKKGIFYGVNNNFYSLQQIKVNTSDIKNTLFRYDTNKKESFDKYQEFVENRYDRNAWTIGTIIRIYNNGWKRGKIIDINANNNNDIVVQYGTGQSECVKYGINDMKLCKRVNKNNDKMVRSTREFVLNRQEWSVGSSVEVFDGKHNMWFSGKIINIIKPTQFQVNVSVKNARKRIRNGNKAVMFCVSHNSLFEPDKISYFGTWEPSIRDASFASLRHCNSDLNASDKQNRKNLIFSGFVRQNFKTSMPKALVHLIHKFCESVTVWTIGKSKMKKLLNSSAQQIMIGPSFDISDGIMCQLTLCPKDGSVISDANDSDSESDTTDTAESEYIVCYLEMKHIPNIIKSLTFSMQLFCGELGQDCRGTIFYNTNKRVKYNAWSWGKTAILFSNFANISDLKRLRIECAINIINIEYKSTEMNESIYWLLPRYRFLQNTQYTWNINKKLLKAFKETTQNRRYFNETLLNYCWMLSCEPKGISDGDESGESNDNVYLTLHLMKLPFKTLSKFIQVSFQWECTANHSVFQSKWTEYKFKLNMRDGFSDSQCKICMCSSALLKSLYSLTFKINIRLANRGYHVIDTLKQNL